MGNTKRPRMRVRRTLFFLMALVLLFFLLQLNQWLPGVWSGGGGSGFLKTKQEQTNTPHTDAPERNTPPERDPTEADTPKDPPSTMPPPEGVEVEVLTAKGDMGTDWQVSPGSHSTPSHTPDTKGRARLKSLIGGLGIRKKGQFLRHGQVGQIPVHRLSFRLPPTPAGMTRRPQARTVRVVDAASGDTIAGVPIAIDAALTANRTFKLAGKTGEDGTLVVPARNDLVRIRVGPPTEAAADAARVITRMMTLRVPETLVVRLPRSDVAPVIFDTSADTGTLTWEIATQERKGPWRVVVRGSGDKVDRVLGDLPSGNVNTMLRARMTRKDGSSYTFEQSIETLPAKVVVPKPRDAHVVVSDADGKPIAGATVTVNIHSQAAEAGLRPLRNTAKSNAKGEAVVPISGNGRNSVFVQSGDHSPMRVNVDSFEDAQRITLKRDKPFAVHVASRMGQPVARAHVTVHISHRGERITVRSLTNDRGQASWTSLPTGPAEVEIRAPGYAMALEAADRSSKTPMSVTLLRGYPLHVAVNDPYGVPLAGVNIDVSRSEGGRPVLLKPASTGDSLFGDEPRSSTDTMGWFVSRDLADRPMTIRLSKEGYRSQTIEGVRPGAVAHFVTLVPKRS